MHYRRPQDVTLTPIRTLRPGRPHRRPEHSVLVPVPVGSPRVSDSRTQRLLRDRPLVFISSAIAGLVELRARISDRLEALDLADQWLFEVHATAAGEPAEAHYLDIARSCDLMVVVVGDRRTEGTEDEYDEAFLDNPDKILPFFLGADNDEVREFRTKLEQPDRHLRKKVDTEDELVDAVVEAVEAAVLSGRLLTAGLRRALAARLAALDQLIGLQPPRSYLPALEDAHAPLSWSHAWNKANPMVVEGPGGAGKTYGALTALHQLSFVNRIRLREREEQEQAPLDVVLPLYLRATADQHRIPGLIAQAFAAVRFLPGSALTEQYATEGRLAVVVDGHDDLVGAQRESLLESMDEWQRAFPRCRVALIARAVADDRLTDFNRLQPSPFEEAQITEMFACEGQEIRGMIDVPPELHDLVIWPFWCAALARYGLEVSSGLALLQEIIGGRLAATHDAGRAGKLRAAMGWLALQAYPAPGFSPAEGVDRLAQWQQLPDVQARFETEPGEALLESVRRSGLIQAEDRQFAFLHPLLAAVLAAEAALADPTQPAIQASGELSVFCAALLGEQQHDSALEMLKSHDIFFVARVLRLHVPSQRTGDPHVDLERYQQALRVLAPLAGPEHEAVLETSTVKAARGANWTALTHTMGDEPELLNSYDDLAASGPESEIVVWQVDPFAEFLPEHLAASEVLMRFKRGFDALTRSEKDPDRPIAAVPESQDELTQQLLQHARAAADCERALREQAGLANSPSLTPLTGEPHIDITISNGQRWIDETWGHAEAEVFFNASKEPEGYDAVARFLAEEPADVARDRLRAQVENEIGSALGSAAWNRPTALAGWVW